MKPLNTTSPYKALAARAGNDREPGVNTYVQRRASMSFQCSRPSRPSRAFGIDGDMRRLRESSTTSAAAELAIKMFRYCTRPSRSSIPDRSSRIGAHLVTSDSAMCMRRSRALRDFINIRWRQSSACC